MVVDRFSVSYINESSVLVSRNLVEQWFTNAILGNVSDLTTVIGFPGSGEPRKVVVEFWLSNDMGRSGSLSALVNLCTVRLDGFRFFSSSSDRVHG